MSQYTILIPPDTPPLEPSSTYTPQVWYNYSKPCNFPRPTLNKKLWKLYECIHPHGRLYSNFLMFEYSSKGMSEEWTMGSCHLRLQCVPLNIIIQRQLKMEWCLLGSSDPAHPAVDVSSAIIKNVFVYVLIAYSNIGSTIVTLITVYLVEILQTHHTTFLNYRLHNI